MNKFTKPLFFAAALLLFAAFSPEAGAQQSTKKDISLQLYSLRAEFKEDFDATIKKVGEMGFTTIEAANYNRGKFYEKTPEEFKAAVEASGLKVLSSHTARQLSAQELETKDFSASLAWWDTTVTAHVAAGMKYIVTPWMDVPKTLAELQTYCDYYNAIGQKCRDNGLMFGYHNHDHEFVKVEGVMMYDYMLEHTSPELVFFQMDVYWVVVGKQSPVEYFHKYPGRFKTLHIKDRKEIGQSGMIGFDAIFSNTGIAGTQHIIVEVEQYSYTPEESVKRSLDYLLANPLVKQSYSNR